jgi:hypothetical protein
VHILDLTITRGVGSDGGAILQGTSRSVTLIRSLVIGNTATRDGGGIYNLGSRIRTDGLFNGTCSRPGVLTPALTLFYQCATVATKFFVHAYSARKE